MTFLLCAKKVRGKRPFKTQEYYNIMPKNRAIYYVDNLHKTILSYSVYKSKGDKRRLVSPYKLTKYRLHLFSPVLFKSPLPAIADNSLCKVFSPQSIKDPIALILMSVIVAPFLNSLMTVMISARLCSLNFSKLNWMLFLVLSDIKFLSDMAFGYFTPLRALSNVLPFCTPMRVGTVRLVSGKLSFLKSSDKSAPISDLEYNGVDIFTDSSTAFLSSKNSFRSIFKFI